MRFLEFRNYLSATDHEKRHIMLKFQDNYIAFIAIFEDFILHIYTIIDDLY